MNPALWGTCAALAWGTADFIARFSGRALGHVSALLGMLLAGSVLMTLWVVIAGTPLVWAWGEAWILAVSGVGVMIGTLLLYQGLARGPVTVVAPIVGSYPALVVAFAVVVGARPSALQWAAMAAVMAGVLLVARSVSTFGGAEVATRAFHRATVAIALLAAVAFAIAVTAGQVATPIYGEVQTVWMSRLISLAALIPILFLPGQAPRISLPWWPMVAAQGLLDSAAYLALFAGSHGEGAAIAAVAASGFGAVTVLLARIVLRERMTWTQWGGIVCIFAGVAVLAGRG